MREGGGRRGEREGEGEGEGDKREGGERKKERERGERGEREERERENTRKSLFTTIIQFGWFSGKYKVPTLKCISPPDQPQLWLQ